MLTQLLHASWFHGLVIGWLAAARVDFKAFRTWKSFDDARKYDWGVAAWNWLEGAVGGAVAGAGFGQWLS